MSALTVRVVGKIQQAQIIQRQVDFTGIVALLAQRESLDSNLLI